MFYGLEFPTSMYLNGWSSYMGFRMGGLFSMFAQSLCGCHSDIDAHYLDDSYLDWEYSASAIMPEEGALGPASWAPLRPGGPSFGTELGIYNHMPSHMPGNFDNMGNCDF